MIRGIDANTETYLADLSQIQTRTAQTVEQMTSGYQVNRPSDAPAAVTDIVDWQGALDDHTQAAKNLNGVKAEVDTAESTLESAVQQLEQAITYAAQGATGTATASDRASLATQVQQIQAQLVALTATTVAGRYLFSGDADQQPTYAVDPTSSTGVRQLLASASTQQVSDGLGGTFSVSLTAQEIFDHRNADGTPAADNVFAGLGSLISALQSNDSAAIAATLDNLRSADTYLNGKLAFYGATQDRISNAVTQLSNRQTQDKAALSSVRDADLTAAATDLTQLSTNQQAAMAAMAKAPHTSLFDFMA